MILERKASHVEVEKIDKFKVGKDHRSTDPAFSPKVLLLLSFHTIFG